MKKVLIGGVLLAVLAGLGGVIGWSALQQTLDQPLKLSEPRIIEVSRGTSLGRLLRQLEEDGVLEHARVLGRYARWQQLDSQIQAGEYEIGPNQTPRRLLQRLVSGDVVSYELTLVPGWNTAQLLAALQGSGLRQTPGLDAALLAQHFAPSGADRAEGWFMPDTYQYVREDSDLELLGRAQKAMQSYLADAWSQRSEAAGALNDPEEALVLASIIEKETAQAADQPLISAVFHRRLQRNMRLQTDPTVIYALGEAFDGNLRRKHLRLDHPYNTYTRKGLPPTPIALPARDAIDAALHPADVEYLYFVARGDGSSQFSRTLEEHNQAVRRYQLKRP